MVESCVEARTNLELGENLTCELKGMESREEEEMGKRKGRAKLDYRRQLEF